MHFQHSKQHFEAAQHFFPGGVNSPVRAFGSVGGVPPFIVKAKGAHLWDADGNQYIDYVGSWGPAILGHADSDVQAAIINALENGTSFGAPTVQETELAKLVCDLLPSIEMLRFVNSGTEACMSAIRLARGYTKRNKIIKCEGCYHGHADSLLVKAGSGAASHGEPTSAGVPATLAADTIVLPYNKLESFTEVMMQHGSEIAAIIIEPVAGNMGCIPPLSDFLEGLRKLCTQYGALLIFDEVMTGFRVALGGAQSFYNIVPDITCLGKVIGGGLPVGAYGGKHEIMQQIAPLGPVYQAGTLSGNPLAMAAGIETLKKISAPKFFEQLQSKTQTLTENMSAVLTSANIAHQMHRMGSMWSVFFSSGDVRNFSDAAACDTARFTSFFHFLLEHGVYIAPSAFESAFMSIAHSDADIERTIEVVNQWCDKHA